jgi:ATP-dependent helicase/nuclease subunit B
VFERAAQRILEELGESLPDLSAATVLLPHLHAAGPLAAALARRSGLAVLIPPGFATLADWAEAAPLEAPVIPVSQRQNLVYQALKARGWFDEADLWPLTRQLLALFDELTLNRVALPENLAGFTTELARAYRAGVTQSLQFEARLIHELWFALAKNGGQDRAARHGQCLAWQAAHASAPVFTLGLSRLARMERDALKRLTDRDLLIELAEVDPASHVVQVLQAAWPEAGKAPPLLERASALARTLPASPLSSRVRLFGARHLEEEAEAAALQIRLWLARGHSAIGLIAQDRLAARRVRALLERYDILVRDETGWQLSTTAASSMLMTWVQVVAQDFRFETLLALLKSPLVLTGQPLLRLQASQQMEKALLAHGPARGRAELAQRLNQAEQQGQPVIQARAALEHLFAAARPLNGRDRPLALWLTDLLQSLSALGTDLAEDAAGAQLLALLNLRAQELKTDQVRFSQAEFRRWLDGELEIATFVERSIDSPVAFTHLAAARLRPFDGVILLGADADRLPGAPAPGFFNQRVRAELGLPGHADDARDIQADLFALLATCPDTLVIWRAREAGEEVAVSPWFERLDALHRQAWDAGLEDAALRRWLDNLAVNTRPGPGTPVPAPAPRALPGRLSVSAYNSLVACPYQYFARHVLKLNEEDEISAEVDKADYGSLVHAILYSFHRRHPLLSEVADKTMIADLLEQTRQAFAGPAAQDWFSQAWRLRWEARIGPYIEWQKQREQEGWRWQEGEQKQEREFALPGGGTVTLYGRLDRIDQKAGELAVLDYKTASPKGLKDKHQARGEDVQLASYALLLGESVSETGFVSLEDSPPKWLAAEMADVEREAHRLVAIFSGLNEGAKLPAQGIDKVCIHCEMRGLCRRDYWPDHG